MQTIIYSYFTFNSTSFELLLEIDFLEFKVLISSVNSSM